jgi:tRNA pseudouridine55 synthase
LKSGVLNLYKDAGFTSHDAVCRVRRLFGTKKVGHTGTLDPEATGVLPVLIGSAAKACDLIGAEEKVYLAKVRFGLATETQDVWGRVTERGEDRPTEDAFRSSMESFVGEYFQIPPMISAIKVGGKKLYEYAREGKTVERKARRVFVYSLELISFTPEEATLRARVSKGTYIRSLLWDICERVGVLGAMSALEREASGIFTLETAVSLKDLEEMEGEEREGVLMPTEHLFLSCPKFCLPAFFDRLILSGQAVLIHKLKLDGAQEGCRFRLYHEGAFCALGEIVSDSEGLKLKKIKEFS